MKNYHKMIFSLLIIIAMIITLAFISCKTDTISEEETIETETEVVKESSDEITGDTEAEEDAETGESSPSGKVVLWTYQPFDEEVVAKFNESQSDIEAEVVVMGPWDMEDKLLTAIASGKGAPDAAMIVSRRFQRFAMGSSMTDLAGYLGDDKDDFIPGALNMGVYENGIFALPLNVSPVAMHYRRDLFEEYGLELPETFDDLSKIKEKLPDGVNVLPLYLPAGQWGAEYARVLMQIKYGEEGQIYDTDGRVIVNNEKGIEMFKWMNQMVQDGIAYTAPWFTPEFYTDIQNGKVVLWITNISEVTNFQTKFPDMAGDWGTAPAPLWSEGSEPSVGTWGNKSFCIPSQAKNPDAAYELIKWLTTSNEALDMYVTTFTFPAYIPYNETSEVLREPNEYLGGDVLLDVINAREITNFNFIDWVQTGDILGQEIDAWFNGEKEPEQAWLDFEQRAINEGLGN
jgi:multiple sugar transport system substrate-binding protein